MDTKEKMLEVALDLFSKKGYESSSVRDITTQLGFKESALYFHYKNKQALLDSLMDKFITESNRRMAFLSNIIKQVTTIDDQQFIAITVEYVQGYFMDDYINKFIMVMNHERSHNEQLRNHYINWCIEKPIEFQSTVMEKLQEIGYLKKVDSTTAALAYYAPIFLYYNQFMKHEYSDEEKELFINSVVEASRNFLSIYKKGA